MSARGIKYPAVFLAVPKCGKDYALSLVIKEEREYPDLAALKEIRKAFAYIHDEFCYVVTSTGGKAKITFRSSGVDAAKITYVPQ